MAAYRILEYYDGIYEIQKKTKFCFWKTIIDNVRSWKGAKDNVDRLITAEHAPKGVKKIHGPYNEMNTSPTVC